MRLNFKMTTALLLAGLGAGLMVHIPARAQAPAGKGKGGGFQQDTRVQTRMYHFEDTNEDLPYSLYVSTKVNKDKPAPLIVTLHGLGATQTIMMTKEAVDLAEDGGYILVAPLGYNTGGWYGSLGPGAATLGRGKGKGAPGADATKGNAEAGKGGDSTPGAAAAKGPGPGAANQPANLGELSEKDVMNVIAIVRKEFKVDPKRMYVMGHSMGGAGALYMGAAHSDLWAAVGAAAPASGLRRERLEAMKAANISVIIVHGDMDEAVNVTSSRGWADAMKEMGMDYQYVEQPGISHGPVIRTSLEPIYAFFAKHSKK